MSTMMAWLLCGAAVANALATLLMAGVAYSLDVQRRGLEGEMLREQLARAGERDAIETLKAQNRAMEQQIKGLTSGTLVHWPRTKGV